MNALKKVVATIAVLGLAVGVLVPAVLPTAAAPAAALSGSSFQAGQIISDAKFFDSDGMTYSAAESFLARVAPACGSGETCIDTFRVDTVGRAADKYCAGYAGRDGESAAKIVIKVAESCGISPKVLFVMLQKEQGLLTYKTRTANPSVNDYAYSRAMGYACPDTAACDARYFGFQNQVYSAARQMQVYTQNPDLFSYQVGTGNRISYHPYTTSCGQQTVTIRNQATANLYIYTPYVPNAAALANLSGTGDACSAYGNRNFWVYYNNWFGSPTGSSPEGRINSTTVSPGVVRLTGWALDRDTTSSIPVHVYIDGKFKYETPADVRRTDVNTAYPGVGERHGFDETLRIDSGTHEICVYGINRGEGKNALIDCRTVTTKAGSPQGKLSAVVAEPGRLRMTGWALDPDTTAAAQVRFTVDGSTVSSLAATVSRPDVAAAYPGYGASRGFSASVNRLGGTHEYCAVVTNVGFGADTTLGCRTVTSPAAATVGRINTTQTVPGGVSVTGWALSSASTKPVVLDVIVNGARVASVTASGARPDVGKVYAGYGDAHGFSTTVPVGSGTRTVCIRSGSTELACTSVVGGTGSPVGRLGSSTTGVTAGIAVNGWTLDYDTTKSIAAHVYVDRVFKGSVTADRSRPDVAAAYPGYGAAHGVVTTVPASKGAHSVCLYGINVGSGSNVLLGCKTVTVR